jgi:hypothetical protein
VRCAWKRFGGILLINKFRCWPLQEIKFDLFLWYNNVDVNQLTMQIGKQSYLLWIFKWVYQNSFSNICTFRKNLHVAYKKSVDKVKFCLYLIKHHARKLMGNGGTALHILDLCTESSWVVNFAPCRFTSNENVPDSHCVGRWKLPRIGLVAVQRRTSLDLLGNPSYVAIHPIDYSLYWLGYPASHGKSGEEEKFCLIVRKLVTKSI